MVVAFLQNCTFAYISAQCTSSSMWLLTNTLFLWDWLLDFAETLFAYHLLQLPYKSSSFSHKQQQDCKTPSIPGSVFKKKVGRFLHKYKTHGQIEAEPNKFSIQTQQHSSTIRPRLPQVKTQIAYMISILDKCRMIWVQGKQWFVKILIVTGREEAECEQCQVREQTPANSVALTRANPRGSRVNGAGAPRRNRGTLRPPGSRSGEASRRFTERPSLTRHPLTTLTDRGDSRRFAKDLLICNLAFVWFMALLLKELQERYGWFTLYSEPYLRSTLVDLFQI